MVGLEAKRSWPPSKNVQFNKDGGSQVVGFSKKSTRKHPITNVASRENWWKLSRAWYQS
jgi:hypothetical protein